MLAGELARRNPPFTGDKEGDHAAARHRAAPCAGPLGNRFYGPMVRLKFWGTIYPVQGSSPMRALRIGFVPLFVAALLSSASLTRAASGNYKYAVWKHQVLLVDPAKKGGRRSPW